MELHSITIALVASLLIYHQVTTWLPLFPWNDVSRYSTRELVAEAGFNGALMGAALYCVIAPNIGFYRWFPIFYFPFLLLGEAVDWWVPYFSPTFTKRRKIWDYESRFGRTLKLIHHVQGKRTPDANHIVLHALSLIAAVAVYIDRFQ